MAKGIIDDENGMEGILIIYVDDIIVTGDDQKGMDELKGFYSVSFIPRTWESCDISWY